MTAIRRERAPSHPGPVLRHLVVDPRGIEISALARSIGISRKTLSQVLNGRARLTPEVAERLALALEIAAEPWQALQAQYDAYQARQALKGWQPLQVWPAPEVQESVEA